MPTQPRSLEPIDAGHTDWDPGRGGAETAVLDEPLHQLARDGGSGDDGAGQGGGDGDDGGGGDGGSGDGDPFPTAKLGLWLGLSSITCLFATLLVIYVGMRLGADDWPPADLPRLPSLLWANTAVILLSSITYQWGYASIRGGRRGLGLGLGLATALGVAFVAGQFLVWRTLRDGGLYVATGTYASFFYTLTGAHALHAVLGILALVFVTFRSLAGAYSPGAHLGVELCGIYWHFLTGIWCVLFLALSL